MDKLLKDAIRQAKKKFLTATFNYLDNIEKKRSYQVTSRSSSINNEDFLICKGKRNYTFQTNLRFGTDFADEQPRGHGLHEKIVLSCNEQFLEVPQGVASTLITFKTDGSSIGASGEIWELSSSFEPKTDKFLRLIVPIETNPQKNHDGFIESEGFAVGNMLRTSGLTQFRCGSSDFHLFDFAHKKKNFLFIDARSRMDYVTFEKSIGAILYSLGMLYGYLWRDEIYAVQSDDVEFSKISGFYYRKIEETVLTNIEVIAPDLLIHLGHNPENGYIRSDVFSNLVSKAIGDERLFRAMKIITEGNAFSLEIRASAYLVALETVRNVIIEKNADKVNPFNTKSTAKKTIKRLKQFVEEMDGSLFNSKEMVLNRLEQLNQVGNNDSFLAAFTLYQFPLTDLDKEAIIRRNDFLHGRIPFEDERSFPENKELKFITYKLHFLVTGLILKYCGFSGLVKNNPTYSKVFTGGNTRVDEPLFRWI